VSQPEEFVVGHVRRAAIALARGELTQARALLSRLHRYDPTFALQHQEQTPQMAAVVADLRSQLGDAPPLDAADLGACQAHALLLVGRPRAGDSLELLRFDYGKLIATVLLRDTEPAGVAVELLLAKSPIVGEVQKVRGGRALEGSGAVLL